MATITPSQLDVVAAFLETSRDYLDIEHTIRLHWPRQSARTTTPARKRAVRQGSGTHCHAAA